MRKFTSLFSALLTMVVMLGQMSVSRAEQLAVNSTAAENHAVTTDPNDWHIVTQNPTNEDIGRAVLKCLGAVVLHDASLPRKGDDFGDEIARAIARAARDELIKSALQDLAPRSTATERTAVHNLIILALDGRLNRNRDQVISQLRSTNPDMANAVEIAEFLIRFNQAVEQNRRSNPRR